MNFKQQITENNESADLTKKIEIDGLNINYVQLGNQESKAIIFIHGFGKNESIM